MPASRSALLITAGCAFLASAGQAFAHAIVTGSSPAAGATVPGPDIPVVLHFNSRIDQERSRLTLEGPDGKNRPVAVAVARSPDAMTATASGLQPGGYKLHWQVLAVDGHITRGEIPFTVATP